MYTYAREGVLVSEEHSDELTPGEEQVQKELIVAQMAYKECRRQWVEHFYEGQDPGDPQAYDDATITVSRKYSNWDIPEELTKRHRSSS